MMLHDRLKKAVDTEEPGGDASLLVDVSAA
jgi:hypothetical protein